MKRAEALPLCVRLEEAKIDYQVRTSFYGDEPILSVRAYLSPSDFFADDSTRAESGRAYAKNVIDLMTKEGDWEISGENGVAYVSRY